MYLMSCVFWKCQTRKRIINAADGAKWLQPITRWTHLHCLTSWIYGMNPLAHLGGIVTPLQKTWLWMPKGSPCCRKILPRFVVLPRCGLEAKPRPAFNAIWAQICVENWGIFHPYPSIQHVRELYICFFTLSESGLAIMTRTVFWVYKCTKREASSCTQKLRSWLCPALSFLSALRNLLRCCFGTPAAWGRLLAQSMRYHKTTSKGRTWPHEKCLSFMLVI